MNKRERFSPPAVGGSSLLVIFAVLCMTVFALLTLSSVLAERRLAEASAQAVTAYYEADRAAEAIFAALRQGQLPEQVTRENEIYTYTCAISDTQVLEVALRCSDGQWTVLRWQATVTEHAAEEEYIDVWDGETES